MAAVDLCPHREQHKDLALALWYHDVVYKSRRKDNERRSADWFVASARSVGVAPPRIARVEGLIMATQHGVAPPPSDELSAWIVDIDLGILASEPSLYDEYVKQVRAEYRWVPSPLYRRGRRAVLEGFLSGKSIFHSAEMKSREARARENIARELESLTKGR